MKKINYISLIPQWRSEKKELLRIIDKCLSSGEWVGGEEIEKFELIRSWIVRQFQNDYNPVHYHSGHISGVGYLKVPETLGENIQNDKTTNENGKLQLIHGSVSLLSHATHLIKPEVGDFYLFPNYLMHTVYPFSGTDEERRSVSFNAKLDFSSIKL